MSFSSEISVESQDWDFSDKAVCVAIVAKIKAHLHDYPGAFARVRDLMSEYFQKLEVASDNFWDEEQMEHIKPAGGIITDLLNGMLEVRLLFGKDMITGSARPNVMHFLEEVKASLVSEPPCPAVVMAGCPSPIYNTLIGLMKEYIDDVIDHHRFLSLSISLCGLASPTVFLQRLFIRQFCADIHL